MSHIRLALMPRGVHHARGAANAVAQRQGAGIRADRLTFGEHAPGSVIAPCGAALGWVICGGKVSLRPGT